MTSTFPLPQAKWIWPNTTLYLYNSYAGFRYDFELDTLPATAPLVITADQTYKLHVNGQYVCRGPMRGIQENWHFDTPDIFPFLKKGHNWISIEAHNPGRSTYSYNHQDAAGLLCSASWDNGTQFWSGTENWKIFRNTAYQNNTAPVSLQLGLMEELDMRFDDRSWITEEYDYTLPPGIPKISQSAKNQGSLPWAALSPRTIPMLKETCAAPEKISSSGKGLCAEIPQRAPGCVQDMVSDFAALELDTVQYDATPLPFMREKEALFFTFPASGKGVFHLAVLDLGKEDWLPGVPVLEFGKHSSGTIVDIFYNQYAPENGGKLVFTQSPDIGSRIGMASRLHLNGKTGKTELFQIMGVRYVSLLIRENEKPVDVKISWRSAVYPLEIKGSFHTSDPLLNELYKTCVHTQQVCMLDAFTDTPWREQSQWWGDARVQAKNVNFIEGNAQMLARGIRSIGEQKNPFGLTFANAPTTASGPVLPDFCLTWCITLRDYWFQTKDIRLFKEQKKQAESNFAYFEKIRSANGLIPYDPRFWLFEDWSTLPKRNYPCFINLWSIYARERYLEVLRAAGFEEEAEALTEKISKEKALVSEAFFDVDQGLFLPELNENGLTGPASVHDQVLALLLELRPEFSQNMIQKVVKPCLDGTLAEGALPSSFWASYLLDCAQKYGLRQEALDYIKRKWTPMLPAGTVWENFPPEKTGELSCAHAWSAHPLTHLPELVFGLEQTAAGWEKITLSPLPLLDEAALALPLPQGMLTGSLRRTDAGMKLQLEIPDGVEVLLHLSGESRLLKGGRFSN